MKSVKKRFKLLLLEIDDAAGQLNSFGADLSLLKPLQDFSGKVLEAEQVLSAQAAAFKKEEFVENMRQSAALRDLEELIDLDLISELEQAFFADLQNHEQTGLGRFLQELLTKINKLYLVLVESVQQLIALLEEGDAVDEY